jgi:hypothetical protein
MSNSDYQNYKAKCQGWSSPSTGFGPNISNLTSYYSPAGSTNLISINGTNFFSYSTVSFGTYKPIPYFINSNIIQFYVPSSLNSGTYTVQVFNGSIPSNSVNYTIDNASGYWLLNSAGGITNTNTTNAALVSVSAFARGPPITIDANYTVPYNVNWIICNSASTIEITLPGGTLYAGREVMIKSINNGAVVSPALLNNIISLDGSTFGNTIIAASSKGKWVTLVSDGTWWYIMQGN